MSVVVRLRTRAEIDEEAALWTWRLDAGPLSSIQQQSYETWLSQDRRNRRAMEELSRVWSALDQLTECGFTDRQSTQVPELPPQATPQVISGRRRLWWTAVAATLVIAVASVAWLLISGVDLHR